MSKNRHYECDDEKEQDNDFDADNNDDESIISNDQRVLVLYLENTNDNSKKELY